MEEEEEKKGLIDVSENKSFLSFKEEKVKWHVELKDKFVDIFDNTIDV